MYLGRCLGIKIPGHQLEEVIRGNPTFGMIQPALVGIPVLPIADNPRLRVIAAGGTETERPAPFDSTCGLKDPVPPKDFMKFVPTTWDQIELQYGNDHDVAALARALAVADSSTVIVLASMTTP